MRYLAIGDIHGCSKALRTLAHIVPFSKNDVVITLGDYVDRGPDSRGVIEWLIELHNQGRLVPLRGNHEIMMLQARYDKRDLQTWVQFGGDATLYSYSPIEDTGRLKDIPDEHWDFLDNELLPYYQLEDHFFVHANAYPNIPLREQPDLMLYWERFGSPRPHSSGKIMVCGHTPQKTGLPKSLGHAICIDTWAYGEGWLTCLDINSGQYWQANQEGQHRSGLLPNIPNR